MLRKNKRNKYKKIQYIYKQKNIIYSININGTK